MLRLEGDVSGPEPLASQIVQKYLLDLCLVTLEHNIQQFPSRRFNGEFLVDYYFFFIIFLQNLSIESMKIKSKKILSNSCVYLLPFLSAFLLFEFLGVLWFSLTNMER
jgi:hypothetical protein